MYAAATVLLFFAACMILMVASGVSVRRRQMKIYRQNNGDFCLERRCPSVRRHCMIALTSAIDETPQCLALPAGVFALEATENILFEPQPTQVYLFSRGENINQTAAPQYFWDAITPFGDFNVKYLKDEYPGKLFRVITERYLYIVRVPGRDRELDGGRVSTPAVAPTTTPPATTVMTSTSTHSKSTFLPTTTSTTSRTTTTTTTRGTTTASTTPPVFSTATLRDSTTRGTTTTTTTTTTSTTTPGFSTATVIRDSTFHSSKRTTTIKPATTGSSSSIWNFETITPVAGLGFCLMVAVILYLRRVLPHELLCFVCRWVRQRRQERRRNNDEDDGVNFVIRLTPPLPPPARDNEEGITTDDGPSSSSSFSSRDTEATCHSIIDNNGFVNVSLEDDDE